MDYNTAIDLSNTDACFDLMDSVTEDDELSGAGINMSGEETIAIVNSEYIKVTTFQHNHHIHVNVLWRDGNREQYFEGTWE